MASAQRQDGGRFGAERMDSAAKHYKMSTPQNLLTTNTSTIPNRPQLQQQPSIVEVPATPIGTLPAQTFAFSNRTENERSIESHSKEQSELLQPTPNRRLMYGTNSFDALISQDHKSEETLYAQTALANLLGKDGRRAVCDPLMPRTSSLETSDARRGRALRRGTAIISHDTVFSPQLYRPLRYIRRVQSITEEGLVRLNQYKLHEEIGTGSYGIVKLAYNEQDNSLYAMKVLDKIKITKKFACFRKPPPRRNKVTNQVVEAPDPLAQVQREIAILRKLNHPNIVKLVEVLDDPSDRFLYLVFEYIERGAVMEIPTTDVLPETTAWKYFRDTLKGLEYLHYQKIIHRDIKPSNLLLSDSGHVKIADFGVSSEFEGIDAFLTGTAGTPAFMAPEALVEDSTAFYSGRAQDIWSLGITLFTFVYGKVPFNDCFVIALYKKIKTQTLEFPDSPSTTDSLKNLIRGMLTKDPGLRMTLSEVKKHPWVTCLDTAPLPSETENCQLITVTDEEVANCLHIIPKLDTLILIKAMVHRRSFGNPFRRQSTSVSRSSIDRRSPDVNRPMSALKIDDLEVDMGRGEPNSSMAGGSDKFVMPRMSLSARSKSQAPD